MKCLKNGHTVAHTSALGAQVAVSMSLTLTLTLTLTQTLTLALTLTGCIHYLVVRSLGIGCLVLLRSHSSMDGMG